MVLNNSSRRTLFLLNKLLNNKYTSEELLNLFEKANYKISRASLSNYMSVIKKTGFIIETEKILNKKYYYIKNKGHKLKLNDGELKALNNAKNLFNIKSNLYQFRHLISLFHELALIMDEKDENRQELINFGYYSKLNWELIDVLEEHCMNKNVLLLEYLSLNNETKLMQIHADQIVSNETHSRIYLKGILENQNKFSILPIDKIFAIKEVIQEFCPIEMIFNVLNYKVKKEAYNEIETEKEENIIESDDIFLNIKRPIDDSFHIVQRLMQFCPDLYNISDEYIKNKVKEKLEILKSTYECGFDY